MVTIQEVKEWKIGRPITINGTVKADYRGKGERILNPVTQDPHQTRYVGWGYMMEGIIDRGYSPHSSADGFDWDGDGGTTFTTKKAIFVVFTRKKPNCGIKNTPCLLEQIEDTAWYK